MLKQTGTFVNVDIMFYKITPETNEGDTKLMKVLTKVIDQRTGRVVNFQPEKSPSAGHLKEKRFKSLLTKPECYVHLLNTVCACSFLASSRGRLL